MSFTKKTKIVLSISAVVAVAAIGLTLSSRLKNAPAETKETAELDDYQAPPNWDPVARKYVSEIAEEKATDERKQKLEREMLDDQAAALDSDRRDLIETDTFARPKAISARARTVKESPDTKEAVEQDEAAEQI